MGHLNTPELEALRQYARRPEGKGLVLILEKKLAESDIAMRKLTGELLYRQQGRSLQLAELIDEIEGADTVLKRQEPTMRRPTAWSQP
jgi:hypothetical protein